MSTHPDFRAAYWLGSSNYREFTAVRKKVAIWTYFEVSQATEATTRHVEKPPSDYLEWIWEIPINPRIVSVGYVTTSGAIKAKRQEGLDVEQVLWSAKSVPRTKLSRALRGALLGHRAVIHRCLFSATKTVLSR